MGAVVLVAGGLIATIAVWLSSGPTAFADLAPSQLLAQAEQSGQRAGSALVTVRVTGAQTQLLADETTRVAGYQAVSVGTEFAQIVLVHGVAYIRGNSSALTKYFDLPAPDGPRLAGRWVSIRPSDIGYAEVTGGVTLDSALQGIIPSGTLHKGPRIRLHGTKVISVTGTSGTVDRTVFIETTDAHLPVAAVQASGTGANRSTATIQLTNWGKRYVIKAPAGAIPISSFTATTTTTTTLPGS